MLGRNPSDIQRGIAFISQTVRAEVPSSLLSSVLERRPDFRAVQFGSAVTMPLFTGGRLRANLKLAEADFQESLASYQKTVQDTFREVSEDLIAYQRTRESREKQQELTQAHRDAIELANVRYEGGVIS